MVQTHKERFFEKYGIPPKATLSVADISKITGIPYSALYESYKRGIGAWKTNIGSVRLKKDFSKNPDTSKYPRSARLGKQQWAMARVYSLVDKGKTFYTADSDIVKKYNLE